MTRPRCACSPTCAKVSTPESIYARGHNPYSQARRVNAEFARAWTELNKSAVAKAGKKEA